MRMDDRSTEISHHCLEVDLKQLKLVDMLLFFVIVLIKPQIEEVLIAILLHYHYFSSPHFIFCFTPYRII